MVALSDDFNRADGALGASWTQRGDTQAVVVASNKAAPAGSASTDVAHVTHVTPCTTAAMFSQITYQFSSLTNIYTAIQTANDMTQQGMTMGIYDGTNLFIRDYTGVGTTRVTKAFSLALNTPHLFRMEMSAVGVCDLWINGVKELTFNYGSARTLRGVGFGIRGSTTADDWTGGDLVAATLDTRPLQDTRRAARSAMGLR